MHNHLGRVSTEIVMLFAVLQQQKMATFYLWVATLLAGALTVNGQGELALF